jgi:integrase
VSINKWLLPFAISKLDLLKVTKRDVQRHLDDIRDSLSEQTTKHVRRILSQAFDEAVDEGLCASNPCRRTKVRKDERGKVATPFLMPHEIETLLNDAILSDYQRAVFTVAICTGLRQGEIFGLTRDCVHLNVQHPYIEVKRSWDQAPKNGRADQRVYLIPRAVPVLRDWLDSHDDPFVFPMPGEQMRYRRYDAGWTRVRARLGLNPNVTFHGLRKTAGTALLAGWLGPKVDPLIVSRTLRHASLKQTLDVYAFLLEGDIAEALNQETPNDSAQNHESGTKLVRLEEAEPRKYVKSWRPQRGLNPRYWRERTDDPKR